MPPPARMDAPLIGVSTSELRPALPQRATRDGEPPRQEVALALEYFAAIEAAGGIPVVIPPLRAAALAPLLSRLGGVCLSGGPDLHPAAYGQLPHPKLGPTWREIDAFELELARAADARNLPILAICRGMQTLNVARGGTLHQHVAEIAGPEIEHRQPEPGDEPTHWIRLAAGSQIGRIMKCERARVNSFHHQAVDQLGAGLSVSSRSSDGLIESVEAVDRAFVIGVQWHVECLVSRARHAALFGAFVDAASAHAMSAEAADQVGRLDRHVELRAMANAG